MRPTTTIKSGFGEAVTGYVVPVQMSINDPSNSRRGFDWKGEILLAQTHSLFYGVLGHLGFLESFEFALMSGQFQVAEKSSFQGTERHYP